MQIQIKYKEKDTFALNLSAGATLKDALNMAMGNGKLSLDLDLTRLRATRDEETVLQNTLLSHGDSIKLS